jgi:hypothetical protein
MLMACKALAAVLSSDDAVSHHHTLSCGTLGDALAAITDGTPNLPEQADLATQRGSCPC